MKIRWTNPAVEDIRAIRDFVARDSETAAISLVKKIIASPEQLTLFPKMGRVVPELGNPAVRELIVERNYRVIYHLKEPFLYILGIVHVKQNIEGMKVKPWDDPLLG